MSVYANDVEEFQGMLQDYLMDRFGSLRLAQRVARQTVQTLGDSPVLDAVGNPEMYMQGYALSLALKFDSGEREEGEV